MHHAARVSTGETLRERLRSLATAAGIPPPPLDVDGNRTARDPSSAVSTGHGVQRIVVSEELLDAPPAEQHWYLAAALGWWTTPRVRRHRRWTWLVLVALAVPHAGLALAGVFDDVAVPRWLAVVAGVLLPVVIGLAVAAMQRRERRALEAAGRLVLRAARMDPAAIAQEVFGSRPAPPWYRRPFASEPPPGRRIVDARAEVGPDPALF